MAERTGYGDPVIVIPLLWRRGVKTGRGGLTLDRVVEASIDLADEQGLEQLSMRKLADRLGVGAMTLYSHVPGRNELIDLMVDQVFSQVRYEPNLPGPTDWRKALTAIADANWRLATDHPWLVHIDTSRPPLGPGTIAKYDAELRPLAATGLSDIQMDQALTLLLAHVTSTARKGLAITETPDAPDSDWWASAGPLLAALVDPDEFAYAVRVGEAAGAAYGAAADHERAYSFGLTAILDGIERLIEDPAAARAAPGS